MTKLTKYCLACMWTNVHSTWLQYGDTDDGLLRGVSAVDWWNSHGQYFKGPTGNSTVSNIFQVLCPSNNSIYLPFFSPLFWCFRKTRNFNANANVSADVKSTDCPWTGTTTTHFNGRGDIRFPFLRVEVCRFGWDCCCHRSVRCCGSDSLVVWTLFQV